MKINRKLNLVLTIDLENDSQAFAYSSPIGEAVFDKYFLTLTKTMAALQMNGPIWLAQSGPTTAARMLKRVAERDGEWEGEDGVRNGLVAEIRRLTSVVLATPNGWDTVPLQNAIDRNLLPKDDLGEVENAVTFFIVASSSLKATIADSLLGAVFGVGGAELTSLDIMAWRAGLTTLKPAENTGAKAIRSSIPV